MKKLIVVIVVTGIFCFCANSYAPQLAESGLYQALNGKMELQRSDVKVQSSPGIKILGGTLDTVEVHGNDVHFGDLALTSFDCNLQDVHFDLINAVTNRNITVLQADRGEMTASISAESIKKYLTDKVKNLSDVSVAFADDKVIVSGTLSVGGFLKAQSKLEGTFVMKGEKLVFLPSHVSMEGMGIERLLQVPSIDVYDFSDFPLGIRPDTVSMQNGILTIHGKVSK